MTYRKLLPNPRGEEGPKRHPERRLHFGAEAHRWAMRQREYKRPDQDRGEHGSAGMKIVERPQHLGGRQIDADFFARLAHRGVAEVAVAGIAAAAGKRDLPRPGVAGALGAMDEQGLDAVSAVMQHEGDRCRYHPRLGRNGDRPVVAQDLPGLLYADISSPPSTLITFPVIQSAPGWQSATIAPPRSAGVVSR
jgi:hypothetical protein